MPDHARAINQLAAKFKNADPAQYETFLRHLDAYVFEITVAVTEAAPSDILVAQGQARMARQFMQMFSEFHNPPTP